MLCAAAASQAAAILLLTAAMTACGGQSTEPDTPDDGQTGTTAVRIAPIPSGFDPAAPEDCDVSVSFDNGDIKLNDEGVLVLHMTVWEYELFDAAEVSAMKPGDTLVVRGQEIAVTAVESADGVVHVNGGLEKGGVDLAAAESGGVFYESNSAVTEFPYNYVETAQLTLPVGEVSKALGRGRHTTRHVEMFSLGGETWVIDTPGFSSFDTQEMDLELKEHLPETFPEFAPYLGQCRFVGCSHTKEKGCRVLQAVRDGDIHPSRHRSYVRMYEELKDMKAWGKK